MLFYEMMLALRNRVRGRMPQAGLSAVKAAEGLFESVPQLLLQAFILFQIFMEPLRPPAPVDASYGSVCTPGLGAGGCEFGSDHKEVFGANWTAGTPRAFDTCGDQFKTWTQLLQEHESNTGDAVGFVAPDACLLLDEEYLREGYSLQLMDAIGAKRNLDTGFLVPEAYREFGWNCTTMSPYYPDHCSDCALTEYVVWELNGVEHKECLSSYTNWAQLAVSVGSGLLSTSSSIAMLPENVRVQWRIAFGGYIVCQVVFRVSALMMATTIFSIRGEAHLFWVMFLSIYIVQALISEPRRIAIAKEMLRQKSTRQAQKELKLQQKMAVSKIMVDYDVSVEQSVTVGPDLSSVAVKEFNSKTGQNLVQKVRPGDIIHTVGTEWLPNGMQRVEISKGRWLSVQDAEGAILLKARKEERNNDTIMTSWREKMWIGLLTIIVPVQFDTIKNIHKSNPRQENFISFCLRMLFNVLMTLPFMYYYPLYGLNADLIGEVPYTYTEPWATVETTDIQMNIWHERISTSRAHQVMVITYGFAGAAFWLYILSNLINRVH